MPYYQSETAAFFDPDLRDDSPMSRRQAIWLFTLLQRSGKLLDIAINLRGEIDWDEMYLRIYDELDQSPQQSQVLRSQIAVDLVPDDNLRWITTDPEQLKWMHKTFQDLPGRSRWIGDLSRIPLAPKDKFIFELDLWNADRQEKFDFLEELQKGWTASTQRHRLLRWFDDAEYDKCDLLWAWLYKNRPSLVKGRRTFTHRVHVESFFDDTSLRPDEINYIVNTIKTRWSQRKYRENNKDKKQFNFVLSKSADRTLDKLAKTRGVSRSQELELLIHEESDRSNKKAKW